MLASQRALFDIPRDVCYLNAASWSPLPLSVQETGRRAVGYKGQPWKLPATFINDQNERARTAAAGLINADHPVRTSGLARFGVKGPAGQITWRRRRSRPWPWAPSALQASA